MKHKIIHQDSGKIASETNELKAAQKDFQTLLDALKATGLNIKVKTFADLIELAKDPESYISEQLWKQQTEVPKIFGIPVKKAAAFSMLSLPDLAQLKEAAKNVIKYINPSANPDLDPELSRHLSSNPSKILEGLTIKGNEVQILPDFLQVISDRHTLCASTAKEIELYEAHEKLVDALNTMKQIFPLYGATTLGEIVSFEENESKVKVKVLFWLQKFTPFLRNQLNNK
ncbi:MAG: hypothetical protein LC109_11125 [Bacteroidia bacterium]|nr:hypothetical protein [Bacteroidia bacterium]